MSLVKTLTLIVFTTALATGALAKGHDQGRTDTPGGPDARTETAEGAHAGVGKDTDNISEKGAAARASKGKPE
ncbi:hypothetical protein [Roseobacter sp.]|uniref:hypothetical protein n=1 Tax=Roseobacter sp. TaxID=1907202 RepID=UPI0025FC8340|nr:hypothetical protein [Roseobacter sp.]